MNPAEDHRHCKVCGKVTAPGNDTCSRACRETREAQARSRQNSVRLMYLLIAVVIAVFILGYVHL